MFCADFIGKEDNVSQLPKTDPYLLLLHCEKNNASLIILSETRKTVDKGARQGDFWVFIAMQILTATRAVTKQMSILTSRNYY